MRRMMMFLVSFALVSTLACPQPARAAADPFIGELMLFGGNFCPRGWADANGQLLPISVNTALFSLLGTLYGGDGRTTFALPDLRGRVPLHEGQGPGLSDYVQGQTGGSESVSLTVPQLPSHRHPAMGSNALASQFGPGGNVLASKDRIASYRPGDDPLVPMAPGAIGDTGGGQAHENRPPFLTLRWCIALQGIFPSRN